MSFFASFGMANGARKATRALRSGVSIWTKYEIAAKIAH